jgi:hypothetical protein
MSTVQEIENAIQKLAPDQYIELEQWWREYREKVWDEKLARDSQEGGRLHAFLKQLDADIDSGNVTPFPK